MPGAATPDPGGRPDGSDRRPAVPPPDRGAVPEGFVVEADDGTRIHFLDWGGPPSGRRAGVLLVPGFGRSAWSWTPVARRLRRVAHVVVMDLRGHGLSDAPIEGYEVASLVGDTIAVVDGAGLREPAAPLVVGGHGFGADVAAAAAARLGPECAGLVLVDGGWEPLAETTDLAPEDFRRALDEPPEVMRSMAAYLADREAFDPGSWDADQERAARESVVELPSGRLVPAIHPHVRDAVVVSMFEHDPVGALVAVEAPIAALVAGDDGSRRHAASLQGVRARLAGRGRAMSIRTFDEGHDLMRYRADEVAAAFLGMLAGPAG